ncbi:MAG: transcriptional regulator [Jatrophihabitans sp.]|nr:MAG: transcriptional regulator [Jatrophihabitans sp.]
MTHMRIQLLGGFQVSVDGTPVDAAAWRRKKPAAVLKFLSVAPGHRLHREQLQDSLWPELAPDAAGANLRKAVFLARRALAGVGGEHVLSSDIDSVWLPRDGVDIDVNQFRDAVSRARRTADVEEYQRAVGLYAGELLPEDRYEDWTEALRDELRLEYVAALEELCGLLGSRGELATAIDVARMAVVAEPLREANSVALIRLLALAGRRGEALRAFEYLRTVLDTELGTAPGPAAQRLFEEIRSGQVLDAELAAGEWERVGDLRMLAGDAMGAASAFESARAAVNEPAVVRLERKIADAWLMGHRPDLARRHLEDAERHLDGGPEQARLLRSRANHAWETGDIPAAKAYAEQAREVAFAVGSPEDVAAANEAMAIVWHFTGAWREGFAAELEVLAGDAANADVLSRVLDIHHCIGQYHLYGDGLSDSVEDYARRIIARAEQVGAARAAAFAWCLLGESLLLQSRWDEAAACLEASCDLHAGFGSKSGGLPWQRRAELAVCVGAFDDASAALRRATAIATVSPMACHLWGRIYATRAFMALEQGDPAGAVSAVRAAAAAAARYGDCQSCSALLNPVAAEAFASMGDAANAAVYAAAAAQVGRLFASSAWSAMAESGAGAAAFAAGDGARASARFEAAAALYHRAGQPFWAERAMRASGGNGQGTPRSYVRRRQLPSRQE